MFKKLRNKFVFTAVLISTILVTIFFSIIYVSATSSADRRPPIVPNNMPINAPANIDEYVAQSIRQEKESAAKDLLVYLIISGIAIDVVVGIITYFLAKSAIKPVQEAYNSQKMFIANAAHEIKTPLAAISANLEAADIEGNRWIDNISIETNKLSTLNQELLLLAHADIPIQITKEKVSLKKKVKEELNTFEPRLNNIKLSYKSDSTIVREFNVKDFTEILSILMDNAIKYCDKKIKVELDDDQLVITNDGKTIDEKDLPYLFDRFYQVDKSAEGVGLGLAIAKSLADRNKWILKAEPNNRETTFVLRFGNK